jgi:hypothetical protein
MNQSIPSNPTTELQENPAPKHRSLHVIVPNAAHKQAKKAAIDSDMSFQEYITRLLLSAKPFSKTTACSSESAS